MDDEKITYKITIDINDFLIPLNRILEECSNSVFIGLSQIENLDFLPDSIDAENDFYTHSPFGNQYSIEDRKLIFRNWLLKKGFEDLIKGIINFLVKISDFYDFYESSKKINQFGEFQKLMNEPNFENTKKHFPELLKLVKSKLNDELLYESEIISINQLRNCFVHRNGIVTVKDLKVSENNIVLKWRYPKIVFEKDGMQRELKKNLIIDSDDTPFISYESKNKVFQVNENINISYQLFNELIFTCHLFGLDLINKITLK